MRTEIRISGFGGQGVGLAGHILGKALAIHSGKEAVMTQAYGPEARGGASSANVVVSGEAIDYPFVQEPDVLITLSQEAYHKFRCTAKSSASILIDSGLVTPFNGDKTFNIPATQIAEALGNRIVSNIVMLGFLTASTDIVSPDAMRQAIQSTVKSKYVSLNLQAFDNGYEYHAAQ